MAIDINGIAVHCDVTEQRRQTEQAFAKAAADHGTARILINCAGVGPARRIVGRDGPMPLDEFARVVSINLVGTFNAMRLAAAAMQSVSPLHDGERGIIVCTASVAAYEGQIGQAAYAASKGGVVGLIMPAAREFAQFGIRVNAHRAREFSRPRCCTRCPKPRSRASRRRCRFRNCSASRRNTRRWCATSSRTAISTAKSIRLDGALRMAPR